MKPAILSSLILPLLLSACNSGQPDAHNAKTTAISPGQQVFLNNCITCHMGDGNPPGPNGIITHSGELASEEQFVRFLRKPTSPMMPPFSEEQIPATQAHDLHTYLSEQAGR